MSILPWVQVILLLVVLTGFSLIAKPLAGMPYRWGTWLGASQLLGSVAWFFIAVVNGRNDAAPWMFSLTCGMAIGLAVSGIGLLMRRKFGVAAFFVTATIIGIFSLFPLIAASDWPMVLTQASITFTLLYGSMQYFAKRMHFMTAEYHRSKSPTATGIQADPEVEPTAATDPIHTPIESTDGAAAVAIPRSCAKCGATLEHNWRVCPHCATAVG